MPLRECSKEHGIDLWEPALTSRVTRSEDALPVVAMA